MQNNIASQQNRIKSLSDQQLAQIAHGPNPLEQLLARAEQQGRVNAHQQAVQPSKETVADALDHQGQGLPSLPTNQMFQPPQGMAGGGIVAFAEGGATPAQANAMDEWLYRVNQQRIAQGLPPIVMPGANTSHTYDPAATTTTTGKFANVKQPGFSTTAPASTTTSLLPPMAERLAQQQQADAAAAAVKAAEAQQAAAIQEMLNPAKSAEGAGSVRMDGITSLFGPRPKDYTPAQVERVAVDPKAYTGEASTSLMDRMKEFQAALGDDPSRARMKAKLDAQEDKLTAREGAAPWMALMNAGFGMMSSKSPYALGAMGEGGQQGLQYLTTENKSIDELRDKQTTLEMQLAQAQRAEQIASVNYGAQSIQAQEARNQATKLAGLSAQAAAAIHNAGAVNSREENLTKIRADQQSHYDTNQAHIKGAEIGAHASDAAYNKPMELFNHKIKMFMATGMKYPDALHAAMGSDIKQGALGEKAFKDQVDGLIKAGKMIEAQQLLASHALPGFAASNAVNFPQ